MLNEKDLGKILSQELPPMNISDIHWKSQDSDAESILFYRIGEDEKATDQFQERIASSQFGWLIINKDHPARPLNSSILKEEVWPQVQNEILNILYPLPAIKLLAVTGTNGKTTTAELVLQLGELSGKKGISIGTLGVRSGQKTLLDFGMTSPPLIDLRKYLLTFGKDKDFCVMEASSHALIQKRLYGLSFVSAGWLSFSQDHLDYHKTMEEYFAAKALIFDYMTEDGKVFVPASQNDLFNKLKKISKKVAKANRIEQKLPLFFSTAFNRNNLEVAVEIIQAAFDIKVQDTFTKIVPPDGRFFIRPYKNNFIVVDFAHTPDALDNICQGIREAFPDYKLKILFGCGGDRDRTKRPIMGKIAEGWGDEIYVTSDNPRTEDPEMIINDIIKGISSKPVHKIIERPEAVQTAFESLNEKEVLLLAGKGHEDYILRNGIKYPYSDIKEVEKFLERKKSHD